MPRAQVELNHAGMAELLKSAGVQREVSRRAENVLAAARRGAPVVSGEYRDSLHVELRTTDRATARVVAGSDHGIAVEARTGNLARSLDAAGGA
jgi:bacteriophage HK97-gp10 putative tail-component